MSSNKASTYKPYPDYSEHFKIKMRSKGIDLIHFHTSKFFYFFNNDEKCFKIIMNTFLQKGLAYDINEEVFNTLGYDITHQTFIVVLEAYRRNCLNEVIKIVSILLNRDKNNFTQLMKKDENIMLLKQIFGSDINITQLKDQSDPLYYLDIMNSVLKLDSNSYLSPKYQPLVVKFLDVYQSLQDNLPSLMKKMIGNYNKTKYNLIPYQSNTEDLRLRVKLCFLAAYSYNLCTNLENSHYLIFQKQKVDFTQNKDSYQDKMLTQDGFYIVTNTNSNQKLPYSQHPLTIDFTEEDVSKKEFFTDEQFEDLKGFIKIEIGKIYYPKSLSQDLYYSLLQKLVSIMQNAGYVQKLKDVQSEDDKNFILTIFGKQELKEAIIEREILKKEQELINIFTYNQRKQEEQKLNAYQDEYIDSEYKCKFIFGDGLQIKTYLLPNEYDTLEIQNFPGNELDFLQKLGLNHQAIISLQKLNDTIFLKCLNSQDAEPFYNHFQEKNVVYDNANKLIVKPLITENLHINKTQHVITTKLKSSLSDLNILRCFITEIIDKFAKNQYTLQLSSQNIPESNEYICYLIFDKEETAKNVQDFIQGQQISAEIQFVEMTISELKQGKITLDQTVYTFFEQQLKDIQQPDYKIFLHEDITYETEEKTQGLIGVKVKKSNKEIIRLFKNPKDKQSVNIIVQAERDSQVFKGLYEIQMVIKPKLIKQLADTYQYNIFASQKGRDYLNNLNISHDVFIYNNQKMNRLEFYAYTTLKKSRPKINIQLKKILDFINHFKIKVQYPIQKKDSSKLIEYLKSNEYSVEEEDNRIKTEISYKKIIEENNYIIEQFIKPVHKGLGDCEICYDTQELFSLANCKCKSICKSCLKSHIETDVRSSIINFKSSISCPSCKSKPISIKDISKIFGKFDLIDLFKMRFKSAIEKLQNSDGSQKFIGCEFPDCKGLLKIPEIVTPGMKNSWQCSMCDHSYCIKHLLAKKYDIPLHQIHDDDYTCEAQIKDFGVDYLLEQGFIKQCPKCKKKYSHDEGCNHLTCKTCQAHFCAVCDFYADNSTSVYQHLEKEHQGHSHNKAKNLNQLNENDKKLIEKNVQKKLNKKSNNHDSDDEEETYKKLNLNKSYIFSEYQVNVMKALSLDDQFQPQASHELVNI